MAREDDDASVRAILMCWLEDCGGNVGELKQKLRQLVRDGRSCEHIPGYSPAITRADIIAQEREIASCVDHLWAEMFLDRL